MLLNKQLESAKSGVVVSCSAIGVVSAFFSDFYEELYTEWHREMM